jgi:hypothetical protein
MMLDARLTGASGGNAASTGFLIPDDDNQSMALRLTKKDTARIPVPSRMVLRLNPGRIGSPTKIAPRRVYRRRAMEASARQRP